MTDNWVWVPFEVDKRFDGFRVDRFLTQRLTAYSRSKVQTILKESRVLNGDRPVRPSSKVRAGDKIRIAYLRRPEEPLDPNAHLSVLFEDEDLLIIDKPSGLLSHPTDKVVHHTVLGLIRHCRPGLRVHLLHRLDRETSGVLALAKNPKMARAWGRAMERHGMQKEYLALVQGTPAPRQGEIVWPIGPQQGAIWARQWINVLGAVPATTGYQVLSPGPVSLVRAFPKTGRLHQVRVHLAALGYPILGDPLYQGDGGAYAKMVAGKMTPEDRNALGFQRVALHAAGLTFDQPLSGVRMEIRSPLPDDMSAYVSAKLIA